MKSLTLITALVFTCALGYGQKFSKPIQKVHDSLMEVTRNTGEPLPFGWGTGTYTKADKSIPVSWFGYCYTHVGKLVVIVDVPLHKKDTPDLQFSTEGGFTTIEMYTPACRLQCDGGDCNERQLLTRYTNRVTRAVPALRFVVGGSLMPFTLENK